MMARGHGRAENFLGLLAELRPLKSGHISESLIDMLILDLHIIGQQRIKTLPMGLIEIQNFGQSTHVLLIDAHGAITLTSGQCNTKSDSRHAKGI